MAVDYKKIVLLRQRGMSTNTIAKNCGYKWETVRRMIDLCEKEWGNIYDIPHDLTSDDIAWVINSTNGRNESFLMPDCEEIIERCRKGEKRSDVWEDYASKATELGFRAYQISRFNDKGISIYGVEYEILSEDVPKAIGLSEEDGIATVTRKKAGGTTVIRASVNSGLEIETYDITIYTNYRLPESLIDALSSAGVIADRSSDMYGIYVKSLFDKVTAIDLSKLSLGYAVEVYNDSEDINYLEYFPNLTSLNLSNTRLTSPTISLDGNERLKKLRIENDKNTSFQIQDVTDIPTGLQHVDASGNAISEYGLFSKAGNSLKILDLSNTSIEQFNDRNYTALTNLDISNCSKMKKLVISSGIQLFQQCC